MTTSGTEVNLGINKTYFIGRALTLLGIFGMIYLAFMPQKTCEDNVLFLAYGWVCGILTLAGVALIEVFKNSELARAAEAEAAKLRSELTVANLTLERGKIGDRICDFPGCNEPWDLAHKLRTHPHDITDLIFLCKKHQNGR